MSVEYEENGSTPVVQTTHGRVRGQQLRTMYGQEYYSFDGIPYAEPPLCEHRFKAPQDCDKWEGILDCITPKSKCLQLGSYTKAVEGSEDCLYLNVYAKRLESEKPLPVMVYIFGGAHKSGDPTRRAWGPDYFMEAEQPVIFITIGYRLGPFGFMSFKDPTLECPGNVGIKDIVQSLKWIKANCLNFNGDPENITVFGHSSGAMLTHLLLMSPAAEGLFHKAVLMAGYVLEMNNLPNAEYRLAKHLGYEGEPDDERAIFEYISNADPARLAGCNFWTQEDIERGINFTFSPCVEPYVNESTVVAEAPLVLQRKAWGNRLPIMLGATSSDCPAVFPPAAFYESVKRNPEYMLPLSLQGAGTLGMQRQLAKELINLHYEGLPVCPENLEQFIKLRCHNFMFHNQHRVLHARLAYAPTSPTYLYRFDLDSPDFNFYRIRYLGPDSQGVFHANELSYFFVLPASFKLDETRDEYKTIRRMISIWTSFAANSNPNASFLAPLVWQPVKRFGARRCLNIEKELSIIEWPESAKCYQMDRLYEQAGLTLF